MEWLKVHQLFMRNDLKHMLGLGKIWQDMARGAHEYRIYTEIFSVFRKILHL
jgi:hypothetical protein